MSPRRVSLSTLWLVLAFIALTGCASQDPTHTVPTTAPPFSVSTYNLELASATMRFDLYRPVSQRGASGRAPLVVVAHGLLRDRTHMAGWGRRLAQEGFVVAVPDMPNSSDHVLNARCINEMVQAICDGKISGCQVDPQRIGMVGLSFGGLSTLLAAADNPNVKVWVGLDAVDWHGRGVAAAPRVHAKTFIIRAPPSVYNQNGGGVALRDALPGCTETLVADAIHIDPEWPSDWLMELLIGIPSEQRREQFAGQTTKALKSELIDQTALTKVE